MKHQKSTYVDNKWWRRFYLGAWQYAQPSRHSEEITRKEADFVEDALELKPPARILDAPCGDGRFTIELARRGYKMHGIDINSNFLKMAKDKASREKLSITLRKGDMRRIPWKNKFDAVINMWSSFGYFDEAGDQAFVKAVNRSLKKGGRFLVDTQSIETLLPIYQTYHKSRMENVTMIVKRFFDHVTCRNDETFTFVRKGRQTTYHSSIRLYTYKELVGLLKENGFKRFEAFGSLSKQPFKLSAKRLLLIAKKV